MHLTLDLGAKVKCVTYCSGNSFHKSGHCRPDLNPGDLETNRCLKTTIGNVYAKSREDICKTHKDIDHKIFTKTVTVSLTFDLVTRKYIGA